MAMSNCTQGTESFPNQSGLRMTNTLVNCYKKEMQRFLAGGTNGFCPFF